MINYIYNQMFYLQELGILLGGCLTVKNQWGLVTGDDVGYSEYNFKTELQIQYLTVMQLLPMVGVGQFPLDPFKNTMVWLSDAHTTDWTVAP